mmetsp:Transcript_1557/g.1358  ORF Transcript_1557/g.1358 Transcript_1557/m.1358 type:complete len:906 (-) Transcript_1557:110-2827(-)
MSQVKRSSPLTQQQAEERTAHFSTDKDNLSYTVFLKLQKGDNYSGSANITFNLAKVSDKFIIDYAGTKINEIKLNGAVIPTNDSYESIRNDRFVTLPQGNLKTGPNELAISFENVYTNDGEGLHSYKDSDGKQYLYSQGEVYNMNKIFPCFDQPDLKAPLTLTVAAPKEWVVIHNMPEDASAKVDASAHLTTQEQESHKIWVYEQTPRLSSYLYAVCAGDYMQVKCDKPYNNIPTSCYCRASLFNHLKEQADELFEISNESIRVYENFFGVKFPFKKNDHIFCAEFNYGAMENPGAITYVDSLLFRSEPSTDKKTTRANTISHELAHFWFGDLVTMKWWNDIWLNESFADYISHWCISKYQANLKTTKLTDAWVAFNQRKGWGYRDDQQKTTHPIVLEVTDTARAVSIFDGITYSKGAASLKQLMCLIGEDNFGKALCKYFTKYSWQNTTLNDFLECMNDFYKPSDSNAPNNLMDWKNEWLASAGLNECLPVWDHNDTSSNAKLTIRQTAYLAEHPTLRHHKLKIAFFDENANIYDVKDAILKPTKETVIEYDGSKKPAAIFLNYFDETFIKSLVDEHSFDFFKLNLIKVQDDLSRMMVIRALYDMVRDGNLSVYQFAIICAKFIEHEKDDSILSMLLLYIQASGKLLCPKILSEEYIMPMIFDAVKEAMKKVDKTKKSLVITLKENLIDFANASKDGNFDNVKELIDWFDGKNDYLKDVELDAKTRWSLVNLIFRYHKFTVVEKQKYFLRAADLDQSDQLKKNEMKCEAILASGKRRKELFKSFLDSENKTSLDLLREQWVGFNQSAHFDHEDEVAFFDSLPTLIDGDKHPRWIQFYVVFMMPKKDNLQYYHQRLLEIYDQGQKSSNQAFAKYVGQALDEVEKRKACFACAAKDLLRLQFNINI